MGVDKIDNGDELGRRPEHRVHGIDHLDMFLPPDIDISGEGHMGLVSHGSGGGQEIVDVSHSSEDRLLDIPWTELCSKSRSRCRKLNFLSNGGRSYLER